MIYDVQQFGAIADGKTNCAKAIQAADRPRRLLLP